MSGSTQNPMQLMHDAFIKAAQEWPHELKVYFILALYEIMESEEWTDLLEAIKEFEGT